jgi:hypothetical protein
VPLTLTPMAIRGNRVPPVPEALSRRQKKRIRQKAGKAKAIAKQNG